MVLDRILERTRADLARRTQQVPLDRLRSQIVPSDRSLFRALRGGRTGFIMECKRASPSEGLIRELYDPASIAAEYAGHADAISVLTDGPFFQGALEHLRAVRQAVSLPVLRKDFVLQPYQVVEARVWGADAILLMLSVLDDAAWSECAAAASEVGLESLTEVHTDAELDRALHLGAPVIGINNRDLKTLTVDLDTVRRLAPRVPADRVLVCESGIGNHRDVRSLRHLVDGFLVGTSLMRQRDLSRAVRQLVYGITKVCGLGREEDAQAAWRLGATHGGLIFAPESPRRVDPARATAIRASAPLEWVGVFVNEAPEVIVDIVRRLGLSAVQLHGEETPELLDALRAAVPAGCEIWKAVRIRDHIPTPVDTGADRLVLDTWREDRRGGTGARFDWALLEGYPQLDRVLLGGGLTPETAAAADALGTGGLDVNSGVEISPGVKSAARLREFLEARRGSGRRGVTP
jgi:indole-3-glycerol phosphate synthase/phosphoribosylanthranilate isomerase